MKYQKFFRTAGILSLGIIFTVLTQEAARAELPPLETVPRVDLQRYLGEWYEIAKFPQRFQEGCDCATANYSLRTDGDIRVLNQCVDQGSSHKLRSSEGRAWVVDRDSQAKLKVRFFWPFSGDYWIIELGKDYEYSVVSEPGRDYLWILSRTPEMSNEKYQGILERLQQRGFDLSRLVKSKQAPDPACSLR